MPLPQLNWQAPEKQKALQQYCYATPVGLLAVQMQGKLLCQLQWFLTPKHAAGNKELPTKLEQQFKQYWLTAKTSPKIPLLQQGTEFQQKVWRALCLIPIGQTTSYGELAQKLDTAPRALANACRKNPFPLIIPCHRVLAKTGIGGYAGATTGKLISIKLALLQHEKMITHDL